MSLLDPGSSLLSLSEASPLTEDEAMIREAIGPPMEANVEIPWDTICLIRELYATRRFTQAELARRFGMSKGYMSRIVKGDVRKKQFTINDNLSSWMED